MLKKKVSLSVAIQQHICKNTLVKRNSVSLPQRGVRHQFSGSFQST